VRAQDDPPRRKCASDDRYQQLYKTSAEFRNARQQLLSLTVAFESVRGSGRFAERTGPIRIPVVVHVVHHTPEQDVSMDQIKSQIDALNADYQKTNPDVAGVPTPYQARIGDARIVFELAVRDPSGQKTDGVTRTQTAETSFDFDGPKGEAVKFTARGGHDGWPARPLPEPVGVPARRQPARLRVVPRRGPGARRRRHHHQRVRHQRHRPAALRQGPHRTHEIGHWLNLFHIWGDDRGACSGSDQVRDTPNQARDNAGCPAFPHKTCGNKTNGDLFMNYMDYTDDACMFMFTKGQVVRMEATMAGPRLALTTSDALTPVP
jgi:hypothetical protein